jgi:hypothetical protein
MPETTNTTQSIFGGNPYLISLGTAALRTGGRTRARRDQQQLYIGVTEKLRIAAIHQRINDLENRYVTIEVRVRDTPLQLLSDLSPSTLHWGLQKVSHDTKVMLCRKDFYDNEYCLFDLLEKRLPFDQWGSATAGFSDHAMDYPLDLKLYPNQHRTIGGAAEDRKFAREKCREVLRENILQIKNWEDLLANGPEDPNAPWFNDTWCITLWRTIKLGN